MLNDLWANTSALETTCIKPEPEVGNFTCIVDLLDCDSHFHVQGALPSSCILTFYVCMQPKPKVEISCMAYSIACSPSHKFSRYSSVNKLVALHGSFSSDKYNSLTYL